jgi:hypothetical protein
MKKHEVRIDSYFSLPTDLAAEMHTWPEFVEGKEYAVTLRSSTEEVSTSLEYDEERPYVFVRGTGEGHLFYRTLGVTLYALAGHSDDVWPSVTRWSSDLV